MRMAVAKLDTEGRLMLPKEVLAALDVSSGDALYFVIHGDHVLLTTEPEGYAPYLIEASLPGKQFPDRASSPEDWQGWEEWKEWEEETRQ